MRPIASGTMTVVGNRFVARLRSQEPGRSRLPLSCSPACARTARASRCSAAKRRNAPASTASLVNVLRRWRALCVQHMRTTIVSQGSGIIAPVLPIILCAPKFLDGSMSLGQVMQAASAFAIVQAAFNWLVDNYPRLAEWNAGARRVASLMVSLDALEQAETGEGINRIKRGETEDAALRLRGSVGHARRRHGGGRRHRGRDQEGRAGAGRGRVRAPARARWCARLPACGRGAAARSTSRRTRGCSCCRSGPMCRPARLRRAVAYPAPPRTGTSRRSPRRSSASASAISKDRIEEDAPWDQTLSGGEKQRLDLRARAAAPARHHRARRGDRRARSEKPGRADEAPVRGNGGSDHRQRRPSAGARAIPLAQADAGATSAAAPNWSATYC